VEALARCKGKPHGWIVRPGVWEVKCDSRVCGAAPGIVVLHEFSTETGELLETKKYRDPVRRK
jgi:hypothetical protein